MYSIITKYKEWGVVVGEQQGPPSMLIRRFHNHCLIQLVRHLVKNLFNNVSASLYFPAVGHIEAANTVTAYQNHQQ